MGCASSCHRSCWCQLILGFGIGVGVQAKGLFGTV